MKGAYRVALMCGAAPLLTGVSVYLLWLATEWEWLQAAGLFVLFPGCAAFAVGALALAWHCWLAFRAPELPRRFWFATFCGAALLASNFPAAGLIVRDVRARQSRYTVFVRNESRESLRGLEVVGPGYVYAVFSTILPGEAQSCSFRVRREGSLQLRLGDQTTLIDGYVSANEGGFAAVTFGNDGTVSVALRGDTFVD